MCNTLSHLRWQFHAFPRSFLCHSAAGHSLTVTHLGSPGLPQVQGHPRVGPAPADRGTGRWSRRHQDRQDPQKHLEPDHPGSLRHNSCWGSLGMADPLPHSLGTWPTFSWSHHSYIYFPSLWKAWRPLGRKEREGKQNLVGEGADPGQAGPTSGPEMHL